MLRQSLMFVVGAVFAGWLNMSYAQLEIQLTQGVDAAVPITVIPFQGDTVSVAGNTSLSRVIQADLKNSGQFRLIAPMLSAGSAVTTPAQLATMKQRGANLVLSGRVEPMGNDNIQVTFQLMDLYRKPIQLDDSVTMLVHYHPSQRASLYQNSPYQSDWA